MQNLKNKTLHTCIVGERLPEKNEYELNICRDRCLGGRSSVVYFEKFRLGVVGELPRSTQPEGPGHNLIPP